MNDTIVYNWIIQNIIKDQEEELNKLKILLFAINPELYKRLFKEDEGISESMVEQIIKIDQARKTQIRLPDKEEDKNIEEGE